MKTLTQFLLGVISLLLMTSDSISQENSGTIYGSVSSELNETMSLCTVVLFKESQIETGITTDMHGNFIIGSIEPGLYDLKVSSVGFSSMYIRDILIDGNEISLPPIELKWGVNMSSVVCSAYRPFCSKPCGFGCICECCVPPVDFIGKESASNRGASVSVDTTSFLAWTSWQSSR